MEDPFEQDAAVKAESDAVFGQENTGINFDAYEDIPVEASGRDCPPHVDSFEELDLGEVITNNIRRCKYTKPTPVQRYAIPIGLAGRDIMACAQTGSGKTAAFCFPIISGLLKAGYQPTGRQRKALPAALILAPTRELTSQIYEEARKFSYQSGIRPVVIYGGAPVVNQVRGRSGRTGGRRAGGRPCCGAVATRRKQQQQQQLCACPVLRAHATLQLLLLLLQPCARALTHACAAARDGARLRHPRRHARPPQRPD